MCRSFFAFLCLLLNSLFASGQGPVRMGKVTDPSLQEISGIIPFSSSRGFYWVHNDSGDGPYIYLIDSLCRLKSKVTLEGVTLKDAEDIAWVDIDGQPYILLADMGNNQRKRDTLSLYLFKEPVLRQLEHNTSIAKADIIAIKFKYADKPRDAEALFFDPVSKKVFIISKRDFRSTVFSFPLEIKDNAVHILKPELELPFTFVTSADISRDGSKILIKNLTHVYYWDRLPGKHIISTLERAPKSVPYTIEPQGEAICFDINQPYFYTISERPFGLDAYLYRYSF